MDDRPPLIVTATPNICWLSPDVPYPETPQAMAEEARRCEEAGAAILHMHADDWPPAIRAVREQTSLIVQCGMSSRTPTERKAVFDERADMISIITSHHDEAFAGLDVHVLHPREELLEYARLQAASGVRLEYEIWHTGSIWNLEWLIEHASLEPPYFTSLFFGWPGGSWSPPTVEEYAYRRRHLPAGSVATVSIMDPLQIDIVTAAIQAGDHVRVGTEDHPFARDGRRAETHELVAEVADLSRELGRPLATSDEARALTGVPPPGERADNQEERVDG
jgi:3-keto-5-aminohexanoate cleavage enzyme